MKQLKSGMTGLAFAKVINENAAELGTTEKLKFERMSANHLANTMNEQLVKVGSDKEVSFKTSKVAEVYNEEVVNPLASTEASTFSLRPETPEDETGEDNEDETLTDEVGKDGDTTEDETTGEGVDVVTTEEDENV